MLPFSTSSCDFVPDLQTHIFLHLFAIYFLLQFKPLSSRCCQFIPPSKPTSSCIFPLYILYCNLNPFPAVAINIFQATVPCMPFCHNYYYTETHFPSLANVGLSPMHGLLPILTSKQQARSLCRSQPTQNQHITTSDTLTQNHHIAANDLLAES